MRHACNIPALLRWQIGKQHETADLRMSFRLSGTVLWVGGTIYHGLEFNGMSTLVMMVRIESTHVLGTQVADWSNVGV